jgi:hypothetical protein
MHGILALVSANAIAVALASTRACEKAVLFGYNAMRVGLAIATFVSPEKHSGYTAPSHWILLPVSFLLAFLRLSLWPLPSYW